MSEKKQHAKSETDKKRQSPKIPITPALPDDAFELSYRQLEPGQIEISYVLPAASHDVFIGLWNKFAFYIRTLVEEANGTPGRHTVIWDGMDQNDDPAGPGAYICRMSVDNAKGASQLIELTV